MPRPPSDWAAHPPGWEPAAAPARPDRRVQRCRAALRVAGPGDAGSSRASRGPSALGAALARRATAGAPGSGRVAAPVAATVGTRAVLARALGRRAAVRAARDRRAPTSGWGERLDLAGRALRPGVGGDARRVPGAVLHPETARVRARGGQVRAALTPLLARLDARARVPAGGRSRSAAAGCVAAAGGARRRGRDRVDVRVAPADRPSARSRPGADGRAVAQAHPRRTSAALTPRRAGAGEARRSACWSAASPERARRSRCRWAPPAAAPAPAPPAAGVLVQYGYAAPAGRVGAHRRAARAPPQPAHPGRGAGRQRPGRRRAHAARLRPAAEPERARAELRAAFDRRRRGGPLSGCGDAVSADGPSRPTASRRAGAASTGTSCSTATPSSSSVAGTRRGRGGCGGVRRRRRSVRRA